MYNNFCDLEPFCLMSLYMIEIVVNTVKMLWKRYIATPCNDLTSDYNYCSAYSREAIFPIPEKIPRKLVAQ